MADAEQRALDYAQAAGFTTVAFAAVADVGLLDDGAGRGARGYKAVSLSRAGMETSPPDLSPEDIVVAAEVEARFLAG